MSIRALNLIENRKKNVFTVRSVHTESGKSRFPLAFSATAFSVNHIKVLPVAENTLPVTFFAKCDWRGQLLKTFKI